MGLSAKCVSGSDVNPAHIPCPTFCRRLRAAQCRRGRDGNLLPTLTSPSPSAGAEIGAAHDCLIANCRRNSLPRVARVIGHVRVRMCLAAKGDIAADHAGQRLAVGVPGIPGVSRRFVSAQDGKSGIIPSEGRSWIQSSSRQNPMKHLAGAISRCNAFAIIEYR